MTDFNHNQPFLSQAIDEKLLSLLVDSVKDYGIIMADPEGRVLSWNDGAKNITGYTEDDVLGKHISMFYQQEDISKNVPWTNLDAALKFGRHETEGWRIRQDGTRFWVNVVYTPLFYQDTEWVGFAEVTRDITRKKRDEDKRTADNIELELRLNENAQKVIASNRRFKKLIENSSDGIALLDENFDIIYRSASAQRINGYATEDLKGKQLMESIHPDDVKIFEEALNKALGNPAVPIIVSYRFIHKQGRVIWMECVVNNQLKNDDVNAIVCNFRDITEKKESENKVAEHAAQVENILSRITDGFIALDCDLRYTYANARMQELLGIPPDELIGKKIWDVFPDGVGSETYHAFNLALAEQRYVFNEDYYAPLDLWHQNEIYPSPEGLSIFIRNINVQKKAEEQLQQSMAEIKRFAGVQTGILDALREDIVLLNENGKIVNANSAWRKSVLQNNLGLPNYGVGYSYYALCETAIKIDTENVKLLTKGIKDVLSGTANYFTIEFAFEDDGEVKWRQVNVSQIDSTVQKGAVVMHMDTTESRRAQRNMQQSEAHLKTVVENTELSIILMDREFKIVSFNNNSERRSVRLLGKKLKQGTSIYGYVAKDRKDFVKNILNRVANDETVVYETSYVTEEGKVAYYTVKWTAIINSNNEKDGVVLTFTDITKSKRHEQERNKLTADLVKRNRDLEQFAYIVSHNLRAPAANITGLLNIIADDAPVSPGVSRVLTSLIKSAVTLDNLIGELNSIVQANFLLSDHAENVSLSALVEEVMLGVDESAIKGKLKLNYDFQRLDEIFIIKKFLHSIFYNLILNSIRSRQNEVDPVISINSVLRDDIVNIYYCDTCESFDLSGTEDGLFDLYKNEDKDNHNTGIGLFMVQAQVESLGGTIKTQRKAGSGQQFLIQFPYHKN